MLKKRIYFDHNATTPLHPLVKENLPFWAENWGNPSSIHWSGRGPKLLIREARQALALALGVSPLELVFTSGASESNNTVLKGVLRRRQMEGRNELIISRVEHPSITKTAEDLAYLGFKVYFVDVDLHGDLNWQQLSSYLSDRTALVSVMLANNETGLILDVAKVVSLAAKVGAFVHSDITQALGKIDLNLTELGVDYASASAHKVYALKGTGITFSKKGRDYSNLIHGGGQERHRRGGTENVLGIAAFGKMAALNKELLRQSEQVQKLRDKFETYLKAEISGVSINHESQLRLPNTTSAIIEDVDGETLLMSLDVSGYSVSTGAACSSGNPEPSPVLLALGLTRQQAQSSLRVSFGIHNTEVELEMFVKDLKETVNRLRDLKTESRGVLNV